MPDSPISDAALEASAERVAALFRRVRRRAPQDVSRRVRRTMDRVFDAIRHADAHVHRRLLLARELEGLEFELRGRDGNVVQFYSEGRLAIIRVYEPIKLRETVDYASCLAHVRRYEERVDRLQRRLHWFYVRAGLDVEPLPPKPWELPYAAFEEVHELIWSKVRRM